MQTNEEVEDSITSLLKRHGLTSRKLNEAEIIARQACIELGVICEEKHVQVVARLMDLAQRSEPLEKRLRGDHQWQPLREEVLQAMQRESSASFQRTRSTSLSSPSHVYFDPPRPLFAEF